MEFVSEIKDTLLLIIMLCALTIALKYYDRFLVVFTGDDRVHISAGSLCWIVCCRCGYLCDGEWTRVATEWLCCCWPSIQGVNLKRLLGQQVGVVPIPIRMSNIIVGDLPCTGRRNFYIEVSASECPSQNTSVAEEQDPKVVQFEESLILRVRCSLTEKKIRIVVKELHIMGSKEICDCYLSPVNMLKWGRDSRGPRRVRMEPADRGEAVTFPPWILMDITAEPEWEARTAFDVRVTTWGAGSWSTTEFDSAADFKDQFPLLDPLGARSMEPREDEVGGLDQTRRLQSACLHTCCCCLWLPLALYFICHFLAFVCYDEYFKIQVYTSQDQTFPLESRAERAILEECKAELSGSELFRFMRYRFISDFHTQSDSGFVTDSLSDDLSDGVEGLANATADAVGKTSVVDMPAGDLANGSANVNDPITLATHTTTAISDSAADDNESNNITNITVGVDGEDAGVKEVNHSERGLILGTFADQPARVETGAAAGIDGIAPLEKAGKDSSNTSDTSASLASASEDPSHSPSGGRSRRWQRGRADTEASALLNRVEEFNPCRPTMTQVIDGACSSLPRFAPAPHLHAWLGYVPCPSRACHVTHFMDQQAFWARAYVAAWVPCYLLLRFAFMWQIEAKDHELMSEAERGYERVPTRESSVA